MSSKWILYHTGPESVDTCVSVLDGCVCVSVQWCYEGDKWRKSICCRTAQLSWPLSSEARQQIQAD